MSKPASFLITTQEANHQELVRDWDGHGVFSLGHPTSWVILPREGVLQLRRIEASDALIPKPIIELKLSSLQTPQKLQLPTSTGKTIRLRVQAVPSLKAAFEENAKAGDSLCVFTCIKNWAIDTVPVAAGTQTRAFGIPALEIKTQPQGMWKIRALVDSVRASHGGALKIGEEKSFHANELVSSVFTLGDVTWRFAWASTSALPDSLSRPFSWTEIIDLQEFKRSLTIAFGGLSLLTLIALLWPTTKPAEDEIIPPQFAKIVLQTAQSQTADTPSSAGAAPRTAQETAVAQAFRSKALSSAVSGLLKGGVSKLLSQSSLLVAQPSQARALFGSKPGAMKAADARSAMTAQGATEVATLGGEGVAGRSGYGKAGNVGVTGQGGGTVSLELDNSTVEEGLTKDEVGEVIHKHLSEIRYCYEISLMRTPDLEGKMMAAFTIGGNGLVKTSSVKTSTLPDRRLDDCILRRLNSWRFPTPKGRIDVPVTYPFVFKTLGR